MPESRLPRSFYARPTVVVARDLLGQRLVRVLDPRPCAGSVQPPLKMGQRLSGTIIEVEAYTGAEDAASHARNGRTARNAPMFGRPGHVYIYLIYGMHHCLNVVTEREGCPAAELIRAVEPLEGIEVMRAQRGGRPDEQLASGPGRLCQALGVDRRFDGADMCVSDALLFIEQGVPVPDEAVVTGPRIGVRGDEVAVTIPWRFHIQNTRYVSR